MPKKIALMGTLDTKGDQIQYLKNSIEKRGHEVTLIDIGIMGEPPYKSSVTREQIARAADTTLEELISLRHEGKAYQKLTVGAIKLVKEMEAGGEIDGILAIGGSMATSLSLEVLIELPVVLPKMMLSSLANSPVIDPDLVANGTIMVPLAGGLWGMNDIVKRLFDQAAAMISAAVEVYKRPAARRKTIAITSLGHIGSIFVELLKPALEERGYDIAVFHATGMSTRFMEKAISDGLIDVVLDMMADGELLADVCGSLYSPGPHRLEAACRKGVPQIVLLTTPGILGACFWGPRKPLPPQYRKGYVFDHNTLLWVMGVGNDEAVKAVKILVGKLNRAKGPTVLLISTKGGPPPREDSAGGGTFDEEAFQQSLQQMQATIDMIKKELKPGIKLVELHALSSTPEFTHELIRLLDEITAEEGPLITSPGVVTRK